MTNINKEEVLKCPECKSPVAKAGFAWSGRKKVQRYRCQKCGRTTLIPIREKERR